MSFGSILSGIGTVLGGPLGGLAGGLVGNLFGSNKQTGVSPSTSNAIASNVGNIGSFADTIANNFTGTALPLANKVSGIYSGALDKSVSPYSLYYAMQQLSPTNPIIGQYLANLSQGTLPVNLQQYITAMNPQTNITQEQGALADALQSAYFTAQEATSGKFGGVGAGEGPNQSLAESYLQQTAEGGANLQSQIAAQRAAAAQAQFLATLQGLGQQEQALGSYENSWQNYLNNQFGLLGSAQGAANQSVYNPALALGGYGALGEILRSLAGGQAQGFQSNQAGLGGLLGQVGNQFPNGIFGGTRGALTPPILPILPGSGGGGLLGGLLGGAGGAGGSINTSGIFDQVGGFA